MRFLPAIGLLCSVLAVSGCSREAGETEVLRIGGRTLRCEIADSAAERARGLMGRTDIPPGTGMLFVFDSPRRLRFWMKNCPVPIDVAFVSEDWVITDIHTMAPHDTTSNYSSSQWCLYAVETAGGWYAEQGIRAGDRFRPPRGVRFEPE